MQVLCGWRASPAAEAHFVRRTAQERTLTRLQELWQHLVVASTRRFSAFTVLAVLLVVLGLVQLFTNRTYAFAAFGFAGLMLGIREVLKRSVP